MKAGLGDSGRGEAGLGVGKVEEVPGKILAQGIEVWWPEEGDRRKGATAARALERSSPLVVVRRRREDMTGGSHNQDKYLGITLADRLPLPSGLSARLDVTMSWPHGERNQSRLVVE